MCGHAVVPALSSLE